MAGYQVLVFDLDDTLLDTWGGILPQASRESCAAMIKAGLKAELEAAMKERLDFIRNEPRGNVFQYLVTKFGVRDSASEKEVTQAGFTAFYSRNVESNIALRTGVSELLEKLEKKYLLYLVTAGNPETQMQKIRHLKFADRFKRIFLVDPSRGETKQEAFRSIMELHGNTPEKYLSIGNRVDTDIAEAKELGWDTCWIRYGEYAHLHPQNNFEKPDYELTHIKDLAQVCQL